MALFSAGRATPLSQQPAASLQQADVGDPNSAAALPALTAPQRVPAAGPLGLKSPFAAVQQALAATAASNGKDVPPDDGASHTVPPHSSHETSPSPQAATHSRSAKRGGLLSNLIAQVAMSVKQTRQTNIALSALVRNSDARELS